MNTIKLEYPVTVDGQTIDTLKMRRPKVRDEKIASKAGNDGERELTLFCNLCEITPATIEELDLFDYQQLQKTYKGFLQKKKR